jgi:RimJ/RimL family protein N-acetyltransferase
VELRRYVDEDFPLTEALETDPVAMAELGGPADPATLPAAHRRRVADPWWFAIVPEPGGPAVGTIGVWESEHDGEPLFETGWMVLPSHHGRGIASAALGLLIERVRAEPRIPSIHAFPGVANAPSNALCRKFGFELLGDARFVFRGRPLHCNHWALRTPSSPPADRPGATPAP